VFSTSILGTTFVLALLASLPFLVILVEKVQTTEIINEAAASQSGVRYSFLLLQVCHVTDSASRGPLCSSCFSGTFTR
jgi:hypothetical protein